MAPLSSSPNRVFVNPVGNEEIVPVTGAPEFSDALAVVVPTASETVNGVESATVPIVKVACVTPPETTIPTI